MDEKKTPPQFKKKSYKRLSTSPLKTSISSKTLSSMHQESSGKKIIPSKASKGIRDAFKETFLPLLIDVFELRQIIDNHKTLQEEDIVLGKVSKSPREIIERLEQMQEDIIESKRWCEGVILQIERGISDAKEALHLIEQSSTPSPKARSKARNFFLRLLKMAKLSTKD